MMEFGSISDILSSFAAILALVLTIYEDRFLSAAGLCASGRLDHGSFPYLFPCLAGILDVGKEAGREIYMRGNPGDIEGNEFRRYRRVGNKLPYSINCKRWGLKADV